MTKEQAIIELKEIGIEVDEKLSAAEIKQILTNAKTKDEDNIISEKEEIKEETGNGTEYSGIKRTNTGWETTDGKVYANVHIAAKYQYLINKEGE